MANKWTRRGQTERTNHKKQRNRCGIVDIRIDLRGLAPATCIAVDAPRQTHRRYLEQHRLLPEGIEAWSIEQLRDLVEVARVSGRESDWERALMLLAHHRSEAACDLLRDVAPRVPESLRDFHQIAVGEAVGWLGYHYVRDEEGRPRLLVAAGAPFPPAGPPS